MSKAREFTSAVENNDDNTSGAEAATITRRTFTNEILEIATAGRKSSKNGDQKNLTLEDYKFLLSV